ncbi:EscN/YscN/HrcN family type III secretion system ATPase [Collibacillus ludicampi]|uniref:EscN/YscN/HrcN family type III secretion system ATPase n=2 Tax=Collibacillus ludicampi TaxID=2771369 RepID=A0AAV4LIX4_9BACL|nr:EscN/YscN/HrcN family type III secretion system ATPase [Collibacillus ludicampi]
MMSKLDLYKNVIKRTKTMRLNGVVTRVVGLMIESCGPVAKVGDICLIQGRNQAEKKMAEVVGFDEERLLLMPLGELGSIAPGSEVIATGDPLRVPVGNKLLGRVLDGLGRPIDGRGPLMHVEEFPTVNEPPNPLTRPRISQPLSVGVKCIDGLLTIGRGQRVGIFAGSGVGKSTLLGMIARNTSADVNVIALIGERGREVRDFLERDLGEEGLARSVVVVATSDQPPLVRIKGALVATSIAEWFRLQGKNVNLMMDSVTRFAMAQREVGLAVGEPPATRGYTPSVFALLPRLLERAGTDSRGTITGFYTVLVDGDDMNEPIADTVRGILDGHIVLSRSLANKGRYPAIDVMASVSRVMDELADTDHRHAAHMVKRLSAIYKEAEDLIHIGAYQRGSNALIDKAIEYYPAIESYIQQGINERWDFDSAVQTLISQFGGLTL